MISAPTYNPDIDQSLAKLKPTQALVRFCQLESDLLPSKGSFCVFPIGTANLATGETLSQTLQYVSLKCQLEKYTFSDFDAVAAFLLDNPEIFETVRKAPQSIFKIFGNEVTLQLSLFVNPEEDTQTLNIFILNNLDPEEAFAKEQELFEVWYEPNHSDLVGQLNFREVSA